MMLSRRNFLTGSAMALVGAAAVSGRPGRRRPRGADHASPAMQPPVPPPTGQEYQPVVTLNGWTLPWRMNGEWKEFHLVAEEVEREIRARHDRQISGAITARRRARPSRRSKATRSASSSPTSCPSTPPCIGTACCCRTAWTASAASPSRISRWARPSSTSSC